MVHLHVREPETGRPVQDIELFKEVIRLIRKGCDIVINTSTGGGRGMSFDEVQQLPDCHRVIRTLHNRGRFKIIVSGSNSKLLGGEIATQLRGRYDDIIMLPFLFGEYLRYRDISFTSTSLRTAASGSVMAAFNDYIRHSGFPEVVKARSEVERRKLLQSYFKSIFYRDILERYNVKARYVLDTLMTDVLETYSSIFSINRFEKQLKRNGIPGSKRISQTTCITLKRCFSSL